VTAASRPTDPLIAGTAGRLAGKVIVVTGAGSQGDGVGNGQAAAITFARHGAAVLCVDLVAERAEQVAKSIVAEGGEAAAFAGDVTDPAVCEAVARAAKDRWGTVTGLVNNVGVGDRVQLDNPDLAAWNRVMAVNVTSAMLCAGAVAPYLREAGGGSIVNVGSIVGWRYSGAHSMAYATSKTALEGLTMSLAGQLGPSRIRVNLLVVGQVWTPLVAAGEAFMGPGWRDRRREAGFVQDEGTPWDVANAELFLLSDESRWITAQSLAVDAGATRTMRDG
jgi:NAD(P)-dependent dehydrogenase (short-subunit alcohol dehydrogenase family)